jgi:hypothetical protein
VMAMPWAETECGRQLHRKASVATDPLTDPQHSRHQLVHKQPGTVD